MIIKFTSVTLHKVMPRLDSGVGQATQTTTFFDTLKAGVTVELDTGSGLVRIAKGGATAYVSLSGVERFGPTLEDAAAFAKARATVTGSQPA